MFKLKRTPHLFILGMLVIVLLVGCNSSRNSEANNNEANNNEANNNEASGGMHGKLEAQHGPCLVVSRCSLAS